MKAADRLRKAFGIGEVVAQGARASRRIAGPLAWRMVDGRHEVTVRCRECQWEARKECTEKDIPETLAKAQTLADRHPCRAAQRRGVAREWLGAVAEARGQDLVCWTIFRQPEASGLPRFIAKRWTIGLDAAPRNTGETLSGATVEEVRCKLPPGLVRLPHHPEDDPAIVESWT